ncbi:MAG: diguanylate cyclase [Planctomycetota bacterium]
MTKRIPSSAIKPRILIADDDVVSRTIMSGVLKQWDYEIVVATNGDEAWEILQKPDAPQLAILDWIMPGMDGSTICKWVREQARDRYTYLLMVTSKSRKEEIVQGLEIGADDYLVKPYEPLELKARLIAGRRVLQLQEDLIAAREAMRERATKDPVSGAWNRGAILEILDRELVRAARDQARLGVILADLDHFKRVNDTWGHLAGDEVLKESVSRFTSSTRPYDCVGRYGGEEFLILVSSDARDCAASTAERLRLALHKEPVTFEGQKIPISASFGVAVYNGTGQTNASAILQCADDALYQAKNAGRNRVVEVPFHPSEA